MELRWGSENIRLSLNGANPSQSAVRRAYHGEERGAEPLRAIAH